MFPVYVYDEGVELPTEGTFYVVASNGIFFRKDMGLVKSFAPVNNIPSLEDLDADSWVDCSLPRIPARHVYKIKEFFRQWRKSTSLSLRVKLSRITSSQKVFIRYKLHGGRVGRHLGVNSYRYVHQYSFCTKLNETFQER